MKWRKYIWEIYMVFPYVRFLLNTISYNDRFQKDLKNTIVPQLVTKLWKQLLTPEMDEIAVQIAQLKQHFWEAVFQYPLADSHIPVWSTDKKVFNNTFESPNSWKILPQNKGNCKKEKNCHNWTGRILLIP